MVEPRNGGEGLDAISAGRHFEPSAQKLGPPLARLSSDIHNQMEVYGSCGQLIGRVDVVEGGAIKLVAEADRHYRFIPFWWVAAVDFEIHLNKSKAEVNELWKVAED